MNVDRHRTLGALLTLLGALLFFHGLGAHAEIDDQPALQMNLDLIWGAVLLVVGAMMLWFGRRRAVT